MANLASGHTNQAVSTIAGGAGGLGQPLKAIDTKVTAQSLDGLKFPSGTPYMLVIGSPTSNSGFELVQVTAISGDTFNLQRGREGTAAQQWPVGEPIQLREYEQGGDLFGVGPLANGLLPMLRGNTSQALAANGTIATAGLAVSRVTPGATCTGVILAAGTQDGQVVIVENDHASNTATFALAGTSHVANGTGEVIAALTATAYVWNASQGLWFKVA